MPPIYKSQTITSKKCSNKVSPKWRYSVCLNGDITSKKKMIGFEKKFMYNFWNNNILFLDRFTASEKVQVKMPFNILNLYWNQTTGILRHFLANLSIMNSVEILKMQKMFSTVW